MKSSSPRPSPGGRPTQLRARLRSRRAAISIGLAAGVAVAASVAALADVVAPANAGHLTTVGPVSASNGFPTWYKDDNGVRLEPCLDPRNSLCGALAAETPDPDAPVTFPDNFPAEVFYMSAGTDQDLAGGGRAVSTFSLEGAFATDTAAPGEQITFGRVRFFYKGLKAGATYTITHPYGKDKIVAEQDPGAAAGVGRIRYTQDIDPVRGQFGGALNSRIGPFLKWDPAVAPAAPGGYIGDPDVDHAVVGSPYNTNFVRIEGPGLAATAADQCPSPPAGANPADCIQTSLFSLQGKYATNGGVDVDRVTYGRSGTGGGTIDVLASSDLDPQSIEVSGPGVDATRLVGENGHYQGRVAYSGDDPPATLKVTNVGDVPATAKTVDVVDNVKASAVYDTDKRELTVNGSSSDTVADPTLTAKGYGDLTNGVLVAKANGTPATVTVTSAKKGTITVPVLLTGGTLAAIPVQAFAGPNQEVLSDKTVTLDGTGSTGPVKSYAWKQTSGPSVGLTGADTATPSFTAPAVDTDATLAFELTVTGAGGPATSTVTVHVVRTAPTPTANAGADQVVAQDSPVTLDATGSTNATSYAWKQTAGSPAVTLTGANTAKPTFKFPKVNAVLTFQVTATGANGSSTDEVQVSTTPNTLRTTRVDYTRSKREWRVAGTSSISGPGVTVTLHNTGALSGPVIGTPATVDALGNWEVRVTSDIAPVNPARVSLESSSGGKLTDVGVSVK
jgi:K319-like protein